MSALLAGSLAATPSFAEEARCDDPYELGDAPTAHAVALRPTLPPAQWSKAQRERLDIVRALCPPAYEASARDPAAPWVGCVPRPAPVESAGSADSADAAESETETTPALGPSTAPAQPVAQLAERLGDVHLGSFTRAGADEAVIELFGTWARFFLLTRSEGHWSISRMLDFGAMKGLGFPCLVARMASRRDLLVCMSGASSGTGVNETILVYDFRADPAELTRLASFDHTIQPVAELCMREAGWPSFFMGGLGALSLVDVDRDGVRDIRVTLAYREIDDRQSAAYARQRTFRTSCACRELLDRGARDFSGLRLKPGCACPKLVFPPLQRAPLVFMARGERFVATPVTKQALRAANALSD